MSYDETKTCTRCREIKQSTEFPPKSPNRCKDCYRAYRRDHYARNRDRLRAENRASAQRRRERSSEAINTQRRRDYSERPEHYRNKALKQRYGIDLAFYSDLLELQAGLCAICGKSPREGKNLDVDHSHETGLVRGLLCFGCNSILGNAQDDPNLLLAAIRYLQRERMEAEDNVV